MKRGDGGESFNFLPLPFEFIHCRGESAALAAKCAGRSAGPEVGRGVSTPPSLPLDSTHPTTRKGLLAPFRPQSSCRSGKMLAASLKAFFALLRFESPSAAAAAAPRRGAGAPSPSAPVGRIHLSEGEARSTPSMPLVPFQKRGKKRAHHGLGSPLGSAARSLRWRECSRREPASADDVCRYGPSREKAKRKIPQDFPLCKLKIIFPLIMARVQAEASLNC